MRFSRIETDRLLLREWREEDVEELLRMTADAQWRRFMSSAAETPAEAWRTIALFLGHLAMRGYTMWAVEEKDTGEFVGHLGPWRPFGWPDLEIGWSIDRSRWGRGYAVEAARAAAAWVFDELGATSVVHLIDPGNVASIRVAEKLGARLDGTFTMPTGAHSTVNVYRTALPLSS
jgi:RimJ/RimL family protein N-acetyltransferase